MSLDTRITEALEAAASGAQSRPDAWSEIERRVHVARRRRVVVSAMGAALAIAAVAVAAPRLTRTIEPVQPPETVSPTSIPRAVAKIPIRAYALAATPEAIWALGPSEVQFDDRGVLYKIDPRTNRVAKKIAVGVNPQGMVVGDGSVWVINGPECTFGCPPGSPFIEEDDPSHDTIWRIDPRSMEVVAKIPAIASNMIVRGEEVWVRTAAALERIDPDDPLADLMASASVMGGGVTNIANGHGLIWVVTHSGRSTNDTASGFLSIIDPTKGELDELRPIATGSVAPDVAVGFGSVWVSTTESDGVGRLLRFDPTRREFSSTILLSGTGPAGDFPSAVAVGNGYVWVLGAHGSLWKVDPTTNTLPVLPVTTGEISTRAIDVVTGFGSVWLTSPEGRIWRMSP